MTKKAPCAPPNLRHQSAPEVVADVGDRVGSRVADATTHATTHGPLDAVPAQALSAEAGSTSCRVVLPCAVVSRR